MSSDWYILNHNKVPVRASAEAWRKWLAVKGEDSRQVAYTKINGAKVSTVFLGLDHRWGEGPPLLFETLVFEGKHDGYCDRCCTWTEAEAQHAAVVAMIESTE